MVWLVVALFVVIAFLSTRQTIGAKVAHERSMGDEVAERERIVALLAYEAYRWAKEPSFLPGLSPKDIRQSMEMAGVSAEAYEPFVLALKPEIWSERAHEWVLKNHKTSTAIAARIVRAFHVRTLKATIEDKLGPEQSRAMDRRLREEHRYVDEKFSAFRPRDVLDKWSQDIDQWHDDYLNEGRNVGIGLLPLYDASSRHTPRHKWIRAQVQERGVKNYDKICDEAKDKFPETWR
jgi:hypothetical protein